MGRASTAMAMVVVALTLAGCGRTSAVHYECFPFDERRPCGNACGQGQQRCLAGRWGACDAEGQRPCAAACGLTSERCTGGAWQGCLPRAERPCRLACNTVAELCLDGAWQGCPTTAVRACQTAFGLGQDTCVGGAWAGCDAEALRPCQTLCGTGLERCRAGAWQVCDAPRPQPPPDAIVLKGTVRDFHDTHPDFERPLSGVGDERGLVEPVLGPDGVPVFAHDGGTRTVTSPERFLQWFHDAPGVNLQAPLDLTLTRASLTPLVYAFDQPFFFPIDGRLFGNEGRSNNYHFTLELHATLEYRGGEVLRFRGDDDIWVFVGRQLVIDLGGPHVAEAGEVALDTLGLRPGALVPLDIFFAERHTVDSSLRIETTGARLTPCP